MPHKMRFPGPLNGGRAAQMQHARGRDQGIGCLERPISFPNNQDPLIAIICWIKREVEIVFRQMHARNRGDMRQQAKPGCDDQAFAPGYPALVVRNLKPLCCSGNPGDGALVTNRQTIPLREIRKIALIVPRRREILRAVVSDKQGRVIAEQGIPIVAELCFRMGVSSGVFVDGNHFAMP